MRAWLNQIPEVPEPQAPPELEGVVNTLLG
jgi:hypothetical protein